MSALPTGKLPLALLSRFLEKYTITGKSVIIGPEIGIDCTAIEFKGEVLLAKTDPITFVAEDIGVYAIYINSNDIAVMGGVPKWFLATILLPAGSTAKLAERVFAEISRACRSLDISFCGGHTEITGAVSKPVVVGGMLGIVERKNLVSAAGARPGDHIILTKGIPLEAASILAREKKGELKGVFPDALLRRCRNFVRTPGISVLKEAQIALKEAPVHSMHDPTEGGLATGLHELAIASGVGVVVEREKIPLVKEAEELVRYFGLNPLGCIASGSLIITLSARYTASVLNALAGAGVKAALIGRVREKRRGIKIMEGGKTKTLRLFERDEITKIFKERG